MTMREAYWVNLVTGAESAYVITFTPARPGHKGWAEYQTAMHTIGEINATLKDDGFVLKYRKADPGGFLTDDEPPIT